MNRYVHDALKEFEKKDYQYLFTSIVPGISHIAGYKIKKKHPEVKWYASFSDPFKGSPYKKADLDGKGLIYKIMFGVGAFCLYNNRYEEVAVKNADKLVFICEEQRDFTLKQYSNYEELVKKSIIMPLTYIPEWKMYQDILKSEKKKNEKKTAVHLGRLYGLRKPGVLIEALKELKEEDENLSEKIVFHQYSEIQKEDVEKIRKYGLENLFMIHDKVSYDESIQVMKGADILVLFDTLMPDEPVQPYLPSKIVEYLMLKKPILGICDENSPSYRILKEYGYNTVGCSVNELKKNILDLIRDDPVIDYSLEKLSSNSYKMIK
jgi:glycosyltransferase involved in cell wall biosynthesis